MNVFFLIDEYTDVEPAPKVHEIINSCIDALYNPRKPRREGEVVIGEIVRQYVHIPTAMPCDSLIEQFS